MDKMYPLGTKMHKHGRVNTAVKMAFVTAVALFSLYFLESKALAQTAQNLPPSSSGTPDSSLVQPQKPAKPIGITMNTGRTVTGNPAVNADWRETKRLHLSWTRSGNPAKETVKAFYLSHLPSDITFAGAVSHSLTPNDPFNLSLAVANNIIDARTAVGVQVDASIGAKVTSSAIVGIKYSNEIGGLLRFRAAASRSEKGNTYAADLNFDRWPFHNTMLSVRKEPYIFNWGADQMVGKKLIFAVGGGEGTVNGVKKSSLDGYVAVILDKNKNNLVWFKVSDEKEEDRGGGKKHSTGILVEVRKFTK